MPANRSSGFIARGRLLHLQNNDVFRRVTVLYVGICGGNALCIAGRYAASWEPAYLMPVAVLSCDNRESLQILPNRPWETTSPQVAIHCSGVKPACWAYFTHPWTMVFRRTPSPLPGKPFKASAFQPRSVSRWRPTSVASQGKPYT